MKKDKRNIIILVVVIVLVVFSSYFLFISGITNEFRANVNKLSASVNSSPNASFFPVITTVINSSGEDVTNSNVGITVNAESIYKIDKLYYSFDLKNWKEKSNFKKDILEAILNREVSVVLDPTYLVEHRDWVEITDQFKGKQERNYILIYSLQGRKKRKKWNALIQEVREKTGMAVVTVVPFAPIGGRGVVNRMDAGPLEILNLFANANYIFTDTFHGMSFSIHFRKQFSLYEDTKADSRKENILKLNVV